MPATPGRPVDRRLYEVSQVNVYEWDDLGAAIRSQYYCRRINISIIFTFTFRAFSRRFYPKRFTIIKYYY